jgi:type VI secretion system protein VasD
MMGMPACRRATLATIGLLLTAVAIAGCSSDKSAKTTAVRIVIEADQLVNPNDRGVASPVVVRVYELKAVSSFNQAQFFELFDDDVKRLGPDLVAKRELELKPGEKVDFKRDTPFEARYLGIVAGFRLGDGAEWRKTTEIVPDRDNAIVVKVTAQAISIEEEASRNWWKVF